MRRLTVGLLIAGILGFTAHSAAAQEIKRSGDFAVGWVFLHSTGMDLPLGVAISDAYRVARKIDLVGETQFVHGSPLGIGVNLWSVLGGIRGSGGSRYGQKTSAFGQVLAGAGRATA